MKKEIIYDQLIIWPHELVFDTVGFIDSSGFHISTPVSFTDDEAISLLKKHNVKSVTVSLVDDLKKDRAQNILDRIEMEGIKYKF